MLGKRTLTRSEVVLALLPRGAANTVFVECWVSWSDTVLMAWCGSRVTDAGALVNIFRALSLGRIASGRKTTSLKVMSLKGLFCISLVNVNLLPEPLATTPGIMVNGEPGRGVWTNGMS